MRLLCVLFGCKFFYHLCLSHFFCFIGKAIKRRFFINKNLQVEIQALLAIKKAYWHLMLIEFFKPIK